MPSILPGKPAKALISTQDVSKAFSTLDKAQQLISTGTNLTKQVEDASAFASKAYALADVAENLGSAASFVGGLGNLLSGEAAAGTKAPNSARAISTLAGRSRNRDEYVEVIPEMLRMVSPETTMLGFTAPTMELALNAGSYDGAGTLGMCATFNFSQSTRVFTLRELRSSMNIIIPLKTDPGQLTFSRLLTADKSGLARIFGVDPDTQSPYNFSLHTAQSKQLFGIFLLYMNIARQDVAALYFERCAVNGISVAVDASGFFMAEQISVMFDKVRGVKLA